MSPVRYFYFQRSEIRDSSKRLLTACLLLIPAARSGKCARPTTSTQSDVAMLRLSPPPRPISQSATPADARENRIPGPSPRSRSRDVPRVAQSPAERGLVFRFSPFSPSFPRPTASLYAVHERDFSLKLILDHRSSFVRGVMGVPLLSGREHALARRRVRHCRLPRSISFHPVSPLLSILLFNRLRLFGPGPSCCTCNHALAAPVGPIVSPSRC